ncbi:MAG: DinB family protein [Bryobacteraceae bacterium]
MNRRTAIQTVVSTVVVGAASNAMATADEKSKALAVFAARWAKAKAFTLQVADAMPADSYAFKPKEEMREYGKLMQHIAANNAFYISRLKSGEIPSNLQPPDNSNKETMKKYLADSFDFCAGVIESVSESDLDKSYPGRPNTPQQTGWDWILNAFIHTAHHRGYAEVYLREKGITPPRYSV